MPVSRRFKEISLPCLNVSLVVCNLALNTVVT